MKGEELKEGKWYNHPEFSWIRYTGKHYYKFPSEWYVFLDGKRRIAFDEFGVKRMRGGQS